MLWCIRRTIGPKAPTKAKKLLYLALVRSQLEYCSIVWNPITKLNLQLIESVQRRATKYITNDKHSNYQTRLLRADLLPLSYRREILDCMFLLKVKSNIFEGLKEICIKETNRPNLRHGDNKTWLPYQKAKTETYHHFYTRRITHIWNSLPLKLRTTQYVPGSTVFKFGIQELYRTRLTNDFDSYNLCKWLTKCRCSLCRPI